MIQQPELQHAIDIIGPAETNDWKIEPTAHAGKFQETAPALAAVLSRDDVDRTALQYQRHDAEAIAAQRAFKHAATVASWAVAATAAVGALVLCIGNFNDLFPEDSQLQRTAFVIASGMAIVVGALATMWVNRLRGGNLLRRWLHSRAEAERRRLEFFDAVIETDPGEVDINLDLLRFEYVRRFLLDSQLAFFSKRSREHGAEAEKTLDWASSATCAATVLAGLAGCLAFLDPHFTVLAALGVAAGAVATVAAQRENVNQDRRNAERYAATCTRLEQLSRQLTITRAAIAGGDREVLGSFFAVLREVLLAEHLQWLEESEQKSAAIDQLEEVLKQHAYAIPPKHSESEQVQA